MELSEAIRVCKEMQRWRRSEFPYDDDLVRMPYSAIIYGEALDKLIEYAENKG